MSVSLEDQLARLRISAAGTDLVVDDAQSPKKQFSILAIKKGWKGGDDSWKKAWLEVFKEDYPYGPRSKSGVYLVRTSDTKSLQSWVPQKPLTTAPQTTVA
jgi:hypothetical protein